MANKKFFWIKLRPGFFNDPYVKLLRRMAGGDTYTIIYLKMLIKSAETDGMIYFQGAGEDIGEELALILDESVEDVRALLAYLEAKKLITHPELSQDLYLIASDDMTGSEVDSANRVRKFRERQKQKALQSNGDVTKSNDKLEIEKEIEKDKEKDNVQQVEPSTPKKSISTKLSKKEIADFEALWKLYPRKQGKQQAMQSYRKAIREGVTNKVIQDGIVAYSKKISAENTEFNFIRSGSRFFKNHEWEDDFTISVQTHRNGKPVKQEPEFAKNEDVVTSSQNDEEIKAALGLMKAYKTHD